MPDLARRTVVPLELVGRVDLDVDLDRLDRRALEPQRLAAVAASPPRVRLR